MSLFDDRESAFENKYAHEQETEFKAAVKRNKLLGLWAAEKFGLSEVAADVYANALVELFVERPNNEALVNKIHEDLTAEGISVGHTEVRAKWAELLPVAREKVFNN